MRTKLHILLIEDDLADAGLIEHELERAGFAFRLTRIETEGDLRRELQESRPDIILSDHGLPSFDGFRALEIVRSLSPDLPFIFVSGSNDQGMVAEMHEEGATDYVFKNDLGDLRDAIRSAIGNAVPKLPGTPLANKKSRPAPELDAAPHELPRKVRFCPECRKTRDEADAALELDDFVRRNADVTIVHSPCEACSRKV